MNFSVQILNMLESGPGACAKSGKQNGNTFADCSGVLDTCKKFPLDKIAIGVGLYYQVGQSQGLITAQNVLDLDKQLGRKLLGAGAWDINFGFDDPRSKPFFKTLAAAWSGPTPAPTPSPPTPPPTPAPPAPPTPPAPPAPPAPATCGTWTEVCPKCSGSKCVTCKSDLSKWQCGGNFSDVYV